MLVRASSRLPSELRDLFVRVIAAVERLFLTDKGLAFHRLIMAHAPRFPEIGRICRRTWQFEQSGRLNKTNANSRSVFV